LAIVKKRGFCRYLCPLGVLHDAIGHFPFGRRLLRWIPNLAGVLLWATLFLALLRFPILLWLDPLALFTGLYRGHAFFVLALVGIVVLGTSLLLPGIWCMKICPLGAIQDLLYRPGRAFSKRETPPFSAGGEGPAACETRAKRGARRRFFREVALGGMGGGVFYGAVTWSRAAGGKPRRLRPPGARQEPLFSSLCVRCGNCMTVCPTQILEPEKSSRRWENFAVPRVDFGIEKICREDCRQCTQVCPSGAIESLSLEEKNERKIGIARVEMELCVLYYDKECRICRRECPWDAIDYRWSEELYCQVPVIDETQCNGCGACRPRCPGENTWERDEDPSIPRRKAIEIFPLDSRA
jgi:ferredoxin